jgi:hypothetical protein
MRWDDVQTGAVSSALLLLPFFLPLLAAHRRTLWGWAAAAFVPAAAFLAMLVGLGMGGAFVGFLGCFTAAALGTVARWSSLLARGFGQQRPASLWIEGVFLLLTLVFLRMAKLDVSALREAGPL